jgi:hypothetical protein
MFNGPDLDKYFMPVIVSSSTCLRGPTPSSISHALARSMFYYLAELNSRFNDPFISALPPILDGIVVEILGASNNSIKIKYCGVKYSFTYSKFHNTKSSFKKLPMVRVHEYFGNRVHIFIPILD